MADLSGAPGRSQADFLQLRRQSLEWRAVEGEVVVLDLQRSLYLAANPAGALLWEAMARGATEVELVDRLVDRYGLDNAAAASDVRAFVAALAAQSLLEP